VVFGAGCSRAPDEPKPAAPASTAGPKSAADTPANAGQALPNWQAYQERGNQRREAKDLAGAELDFTAAVKLAPPNPALYYLRGITRNERGNHAGAIEDYDAVLKLDPGNATVPILRQQSVEAAKLAELKRQGVPYDWQSYQERGNKRRASGDLAGASADFSEAIKLGPPNTALFYLRGITRAELGDHVGAIKDFDAVLKLDPGNVTVPGLRAKSVANL
jgi:lipoprotein NlpI